MVEVAKLGSVDHTGMGAKRVLDAVEVEVAIGEGINLFLAEVAQGEIEAAIRRDLVDALDDAEVG